MQKNLLKCVENSKLTGDDFNQLYKKKRKMPKVQNCDAMKKNMLSSGKVKKNMFKVYHFDSP